MFHDRLRREISRRFSLGPAIDNQLRFHTLQYNIEIDWTFG